ncbi:MAG: hypothetical protein ACP5QY_10405, partial [Candidatus Hydrogenedens sp.]
DSLFRMPSFYFRSLFEKELKTYDKPFEYVEFFEQCEYGRAPSRFEIDELFTLERKFSQGII